MQKMMRLCIAAVLILLSSLLATAQNFDASIVPSEVEGSVLEVPVNGSRQISFRVTYVEDDSIFQPALLYNGAKLAIGRTNLEENGYLHIVRRSCNDSNSPGVRCELLQVTVNGVTFLNGSRLNFSVVVGSTFHYTSKAVSISLVDTITTTTSVEELTTTTTTPPTTTSEPTSPAETTLPEVSLEARKDECRAILTTEIVAPWVIVGVLGILQLVTLGLLILVLCKKRNRQKQDVGNERSPGSSLDKLPRSDDERSSHNDSPL